jgi:hypothetical protein
MSEQCPRRQDTVRGFLYASMVFALDLLDLIALVREVHAL